MVLDPKLATAFANAQNLGNLSGTSSIWSGSGTFAPTRTEEFFRFTMSARSQMSIQLSNSVATADLQLRDSNGAVIGTCVNAGVAVMTGQLGPGTYFIRVNTHSPSTAQYALELRGMGSAIDPGSTTSQAIDLGSSSTNASRAWSNSVGAADLQDNYTFRVTQAGTYNFSLRDLTGDASLQLLSSTGSRIALSNNPSLFGEMIQQVLNPGTYSLVVKAENPSANSTANYRLQVASTVTNRTPSNLQFGGTKTQYTTAESFTLTNGLVYDANGFGDVSRVDLRLQRSDTNTWTDLSDVTRFTSGGTGWSSFNHSFSLSGLAPGNYVLSGVAHDRSGAISNRATYAFSVQHPNQAPASLQFELAKSTLLPSETLTLRSGSVMDANGAVDLARIDFRVLRSDNTWVDVSDVTAFSFTSGSQSANFAHSLNLGSFTAGNYTLWAQAYDKAGAVSNSFTRAFTIQSPVINDWFSQNLKDSGLIGLARDFARDLELSRNDMLALFRNAQDNSAIDAQEQTDFGALLRTSAPFRMADHVRYLSQKVVESTIANMTSQQFEENLIGRWFMGKAQPTPVFNHRTKEGIIRYDFTYREFNSNLFGPTGQARIGDIDQRRFGNCALLAALGATFGRQSNDAGNQVSGIINDMLIDNGVDSLTGKRSFTVRFYKPKGEYLFDGKDEFTSEWVTVDNQLATWNGALFGASNQDGLWAPVLEKAYALWRESWQIGTASSGYDLTGNGDTIYNPMRYILGRVVTVYGKLATSSVMEKYRNSTAIAPGQLTFDLLNTSLSQNKSITAGGAVGNPFLVPTHAYSVTNAYTLNGQQRVVIRNPWGIDVNVNDPNSRYSGNASDGFVDLSFDDFYRAFSEVAIA